MWSDKNQKHDPIWTFEFLFIDNFEYHIEISYFTVGSNFEICGFAKMSKKMPSHIPYDLLQDQHMLILS